MDCSKCDKSFDSEAKLKAHVFMVHEPKVNCAYCSDKYHKVRIKQHERSCDNNPENIKVCPVCEKEFSDSGDQTYCSRTCASHYARSTRNKKKRYCLNCNNLLSRKQQKYCSNKCQQAFQRKQIFNKIEKGKIFSPSTMKKYLINKTGESCDLCNWNKTNIYTNKIPIELDHIDGNYKNNNLENLRLLCPNCHSLTKTYKGANRGNGRDYR